MYIFIESIDDLSFLNNELLKKSHIGVDTEFRRTTKYNMKLALLQINDGDEIYLIDALRIRDPGDSCTFLESPSVTKIFHSCKEDLEAVYAWTGRKMINIFDTQIANSFLGGSYSIGYQSLVEQELSIELEKNETRSNWFRRPLSSSQLKYAALDVEYLLYLYSIQIKDLKKFHKIEWLEEEVKFLIKNTFNPHLLELDTHRSISRSEEDLLLKKLNVLVRNIALKNNINETLLFSKRIQKYLLRSALVSGVDRACEEFTDWRKGLIMEDLTQLIL